MTWTALTFPFASQLTSTQMTQLQANFAAMAAGDSGAPSIATAGIADSAITTAKILNATAASSPAAVAWRMCLSTTTEFTTALTAADATWTFGNVGPNNICLRANVAGTYQVNVAMAESGGGTARLTVYVNGVQAFQFSESSNYPTFAVQTAQDLTVAAGDLVTLSLWGDGVGVSAYFRNLRFLIDTQTTAPIGA